MHASAQGTVELHQSMNTFLPCLSRRKSRPVCTVGKATSHVYTTRRTKHVLAGHAGTCGTTHTYRSTPSLMRHMFGSRDLPSHEPSHPPAVPGTHSCSCPGIWALGLSSTQTCSLISCRRQGGGSWE